MKLVLWLVVAEAAADTNLNPSYFSKGAGFFYFFFTGVMRTAQYPLFFIAK